MATNVYFQSGNTAGRSSEQSLVEDLVLESIRIYGHDVFYIPRQIVNRDSLFDEDALSEFKQLSSRNVFRKCGWIRGRR